MKATVVLIPTVEEQRAAGEHEIIVPEGVRLPTEKMPLFRGLNYQIPQDLIGSVTRVWLEDGRILAEMEIDFMDVAWGGYPKDDGSFDLLSIGITNKPAKPYKEER